MLSSEIERSWPELFTEVTFAQRAQLRGTFAALTSEGWLPDHDAVEDIVLHARGLISISEVLTRAARRSAAHARGEQTASSAK